MNSLLRHTLLIALLFWTPSALACKCMEPDAQSSLDRNEVVFRGTALRQLTSAVKNEVRYVVRVGRIIKGCKIASGDRIIIKTGIDRSNCGIAIKSGGNYVFMSGAPEPVTSADNLGKKGLGITEIYSVNACDYNREWSLVSEEDKKIFRSYDNICDVVEPTPCKTGADCPSTHYCDTDTCVAYDAKCPDGIMMPVCADDPCLVAKPCTEAKCYPSVCSGCHAIFVDPTGTRVCHI